MFVCVCVCVMRTVWRQTSFSIQTCPLQAAKQPNSPNSTMAPPVALRTYGAFDWPVEMSSAYGPNMKLHHNPTDSSTTPVT